MVKTGFSGAQYFTKGLHLVRQKGIRHYVILPLLINLVLLSAGCIWLFTSLMEWKDDIYQSSGSIVQWFFDNLGWLIWPIAFIAIFITVFYFFAIIANWLAAPFNGLLAEAVERHLSGESINEDTGGFVGAMKDLPRIFGREWAKFKYWLPKAIGCLLLFLIPGVNLIAPVVWFIFSAWMMSVQYVDYPMDNHKISFQTMLEHLRAKRGGPLGFGSMILLVTMIPVLNILVMPVAVAGATALWFENYRQES
ncbi:sulfate transporter CysZ [Pleionea sediminis]|uniref:sulfate transporter CysZ n=1 Tax=Pleionea sediminis TaxID=2569479 RepID=UPI001186BAE1|nr:sulfate transporter CysZ [Pleionea sediminis]